MGVHRLNDNRNIGAAGVKALSNALNAIKPVLEVVRSHTTRANATQPLAPSLRRPSVKKGGVRA
jgi:hypothetical protein